MSATDDAIKANRTFADNFELGDLPRPPARKLAVVTCLDARLILDQMLGLKPGDANIIRNAGGIITDDALSSLILSHHLLGTQEFIIINHTDCGMLTFKEDELLQRLQNETGVATPSPVHFQAFSDLEANVCQQIQRVKAHPWIPDSVSVRGFIYDVKTGLLREVAPTEESANTEQGAYAMRNGQPQSYTQGI